MPPRNATVIVSNRLPVHRTRKKRGGSGWETSPGGLVSALKPILAERDSTWVGWADAPGETPAPFRHDGVDLMPVPLTRGERTAYYDGFSNRTLWPLYHDAIRPPEYRRRWWGPYVDVNRRFAEAAARAVKRGGVVWVHDYHLQLVPAMIRELRSDVRIGFFLHIPFPPQELFAQLPWRRDILQGMLGADVVGFQTKPGAQNFARLCRRYAEAGGRGGELEVDGRVVHARAFPISIDVDYFESLARSDDVRLRARKFHRRLGENRRVVLGVDRMDYTKGIDIRLKAYRDLLEAGAWTPDDLVFVQVGVPSRERVAEYQDLRSGVEELIGQINGEFGELGRTPVHYLHRGLPIEELAALYCAADVMVVTPLRDGMNLVAKEYVATRYDDSGVLILSEFTGAAKELKSALIVNPHDVDELDASLAAALRMKPDEQRRRMRSLRRAVRRRDVFQWAREFFEALAA